MCINLSQLVPILRTPFKDFIGTYSYYIFYLIRMSRSELVLLMLYTRSLETRQVFLRKEFNCTQVNILKLL